MIVAVAWAAGITASELICRRLIPSRAKAWVVAYAILLVAAVATGGGLAPHRHSSSIQVIAGLVLAAGGYQLGRALLKDKPTIPPPDTLWLDVASVGLLVPVVEEMTWGARVETHWGIIATAVAFAAKHVVIDRRWRRGLGLALFWVGLGLIRADLAWLALTVHVVVNLSGVVIGHVTKKDQF